MRYTARHQQPSEPQEVRRESSLKFIKSSLKWEFLSCCLHKQLQVRGVHHSGSKHAPSAHPVMSSSSSPPNSDLKLVTMSLAKENESGTLGISIIGGKVRHINSVLIALQLSGLIFTYVYIVYCMQDSGSHGDIGIFVKTLAEGGVAHQVS